MKPRKMRLEALSAAAAFGMTAFALAFAEESGLVKVDIKNVADAIARNTNLEEGKIPLLVQAPADVASDVCTVSENVLRQQGGGAGVGCVATMTSPALEKIVKHQVEVNKPQ
jgi:hypothetical protein